MAKFYGNVGYAVQGESAPGVWDVTVTERPYSGDVVRNSRYQESSNKVNDDININNSISILADPYAYQHISNMKYIIWMDTAWEIKDVEVSFPRLILTIGGVYNGKQA